MDTEIEAASGWGGRRQGAGRKKGTPNKVTADIRTAARVYGPSALDQLAKLAGLVDGVKGAENEHTRVAACKEILDRAYGKSPQALTVDPGDKVVDFMKELMALTDGNSRGSPEPQGKEKWLNG